MSNLCLSLSLIGGCTRNEFPGWKWTSKQSVHRWSLLVVSGTISVTIRTLFDPASKLQPLRDLAASKAKSLTASSQTFQPGIIVRRMKNYKGNSCTVTPTFSCTCTTQTGLVKAPVQSLNWQVQSLTVFVLSLEPGFPLSQAMVMPMPSSMLGVQQALLSELRGQ